MPRGNRDLARPAAARRDTAPGNRQDTRAAPRLQPRGPEAQQAPNAPTFLPYAERMAANRNPTARRKSPSGQGWFTPGSPAGAEGGAGLLGPCAAKHVLPEPRIGRPVRTSSPSLRGISLQGMAGKPGSLSQCAVHPDSPSGTAGLEAVNNLLFEPQRHSHLRIVGPGSPAFAHGLCERRQGLAERPARPVQAAHGRLRAHPDRWRSCAGFALGPGAVGSWAAPLLSTGSPHRDRRNAFGARGGERHGDHCDIQPTDRHVPTAPCRNHSRSRKRAVHPNRPRSKPRVARLDRRLGSSQTVIGRVSALRTPVPRQSATPEAVAACTREAAGVANRQGSERPFRPASPLPDKSRCRRKRSHPSACYVGEINPSSASSSGVTQGRFSRQAAKPRLDSASAVRQAATVRRLPDAGAAEALGKAFRSGDSPTTGRVPVRPREPEA